LIDTISFLSSRTFSLSRGPGRPPAVSFQVRRSKRTLLSSPPCLRCHRANSSPLFSILETKRIAPVSRGLFLSVPPFRCFLNVAGHFLKPRRVFGFSREPLLPFPPLDFDEGELLARTYPASVVGDRVAGPIYHSTLPPPRQKGVPVFPVGIC